MKDIKLKNRKSVWTPDFVNWLNVGLMLISLVAAFILPFEVFLLAYAILGPLHYLTEISWLHDRRFFLKSRKEIIFFVVIALLLLISTLSAFTGNLSGLGKGIIAIAPGLIFAGFVFAFGALYLKKFWQKALVFFLAFLLVILTGWQSDPIFKAWFAVMLPTLIHVFIFTGAFILYGAMKGRSGSGIFSFVVFLGCALFCFFYVPASVIVPSQFVSTNFPIYFGINETLSEILNFGQVNQVVELFKSPQAIALMRFIAFAYTYHYLNWFSKTSVIKWNQISPTRFAVIISLWIVALLLYLSDYVLGFVALYLLSMLHVFLEFPLNHLTFVGILKEAKTIFSGTSASRN